MDPTPHNSHYGVGCLGSGGSTCIKKNQTVALAWLGEQISLPDKLARLPGRDIHQGMRQSTKCSGAVSAAGLEHRLNVEAQSEEWMSKMTAVQHFKGLPPVVCKAWRWRELTAAYGCFNWRVCMSLGAPQRSSQFVVHSFPTQWSLRSAIRLSSLPILQLPAELPQKWAQCVCLVFTIADSLSLAPWPLKLVLL